MRPLLASLPLVVALLLTGCADHDGTPSDSPTPSPSEPSAASPSESSVADLPPARDACKVLDPADVGRLLGAEVEAVVADQGCRFASPDDPEATSLGISQGDLLALGGLDGARAGIGTVVEGKVEDLPGVGDGAFVVVGPTSFGGAEGVTGGGAVALGSSLVQITVLPGPEATRDDVRRTTVDVLTLIAEHAQR